MSHNGKLNAADVVYIPVHKHVAELIRLRMKIFELWNSLWKIKADIAKEPIDTLEIERENKFYDYALKQLDELIGQETMTGME